MGRHWQGSGASRLDHISRHRHHPESTAQAPVPTEKPSQPIRLDIDSLTVNNARVEYNDEKTGKQFSAESIQLSTGPVHDSTNIPVKLTAFLGTNQPVLRVRTELNGELRFERALQRYKLEDMKLSGEVAGDPLQGKTMTFAAQGQLLLDKAANVAEWTGIKISANQLRALGELKVNDLDKTPQINGGISIAQFDLAKFVDSIGQTLPIMAEGSLSKVELVSRVAGTPTSVSFDNINLKVDDSSFSGRLAVEDFAKQSLRAVLKVDTFNVDRYLPPKSAEANSATQVRKAEVASTEANALAGAGSTPLPEKPTKGPWSTARLLPVERLSQLDVDADLTFGQLTLDKLSIQNAALKATAQGGLLTLETLRGDLYDGNFDAKGTLDVRQQVPAMNLQTRLSKVPVEKILESQGKNPPVKGLVTLNSNLTGSGNSESALIDSLNGNASFVINNGVLLNANLEQQLCKGIATLNRKTLSGEPRGKDTPFQELKGNLILRNGVASNPDLKVRIPGMTVNGDGDVDLRVLGMDYRVGVIVEGDKSDMPDPACQVGEKFIGIEWPLRCRGPLELGAKACRLDNERMGQVASKLAGEKISEKIDEKLGDKVSPELKNALKGLFKR